MSEYRIAGYVKLAKLWERSRDEAISFHADYYKSKFENNSEMTLHGVYIDITGNKETWKRPNMVRLLRDCATNKIDCIATQTKAYLAANTEEFFFVLFFLFSLPNRIDMGFFQQEEFRSVCNKRPYMGLQKEIMKYYRERAVADIDEALRKVEPYNRFMYMNLMTMKLEILKLVEGKKHIDQSKKTYVDLYQQLYDAGLHLDAVHVLMTLIDECSSAYNVLIWRPFWPGAMYYSDYIANAPPVPDPLPDPDGIHLQYFRLQIPVPFTVHPLQDKVIKEYIDEVIKEFRSWENHPFKVNLSIELAHILMCLDRKEEAKEFYMFFQNSGVSEMQMASWAREELEALTLELGM